VFSPTLLADDVVNANRHFILTVSIADDTAEIGIVGRCPGPDPRSFRPTSGRPA
jgi:hypothetical protein